MIRIRRVRDSYGYLVVCETNQQAAIIEPSEAEPVLRRIDQERVTPTAILNTHHRRDHTGGNEGIVAAHKVRVYPPSQKGTDVEPWMNARWLVIATGRGDKSCSRNNGKHPSASM